MGWLDLVGWGGSALLVYSVMQARVLRFRVLNLAACIVLAGFNAALGIWPMVAMNVALVAINAWHLRALVRTRHDEAAYRVLRVGLEDAYLRHVVETHLPDMRRHQPDLVWDAPTPGRQAFLVVRGDETVGVVLLRAQPGGTAYVELDWVSPRFRDFTVGAFVWRRSGLLRDLGFERVVTSPAMVDPYYDRVGFHRVEDHWELDLAG